MKKKGINLKSIINLISMISIINLKSIINFVEDQEGNDLFRVFSKKRKKYQVLLSLVNVYAGWTALEQNALPVTNQGFYLHCVTKLLWN